MPFLWKIPTATAALKKIGAFGERCIKQRIEKGSSNTDIFHYLVISRIYRHVSRANILCQYNDADSWSLDDLVRATSIPREYLKPILETLAKPKILVGDGDVYRLNLGQQRIEKCM